MLNTNITNFRKNIFNMLEQTIKYNEPINISTKDGNAVVISEEVLNSCRLTKQN
jgi:PHD/YefM family antitoxin component YafN of YafNO toxin-antitoxin module